MKEEIPEIDFREIIQNEKNKEIEEKLKLQEEKKVQAEEEMMRLAIEMSMKQFEEEQKNQEKPKNSLASALQSKDAKNKYSKQGFIPKSQKQQVKADNHLPQENISENQSYYNDYYEEYDYQYHNNYYPIR